MSFIDDKEKMKDFRWLTKDEFLKTYSYLTEQEYEETKKDYIKRMPRSITTLDYLQECKEQIQHNIDCYSEGYLISKPKEEYRKEWLEEQQKLKIVDKLIENERLKSRVKSRER